MLSLENGSLSTDFDFDGEMGILFLSCLIKGLEEEGCGCVTGLPLLCGATIPLAGAVLLELLPLTNGDDCVCTLDLGTSCVCICALLYED